MRCRRTGRCCSGWRTGCWAACTTPRTCSRRRTCAGSAPTGRGRRAAPLPVQGGDPAGRWTGCGPGRPPGRRTSGRGCPSRCRPSRPRSARWTAPSCATRSPPRCCTCWNGSPRRSARSTCCTPRSTCRTPRSATSWTGRRPTAGSCTTGRPPGRRRSPRFTAGPAEQQRLLDAFLAACPRRRPGRLTELVAADASRLERRGRRRPRGAQPGERRGPDRPLLRRPLRPGDAASRRPLPSSTASRRWSLRWPDGDPLHAGHRGGRRPDHRTSTWSATRRSCPAARLNTKRPQPRSGVGAVGGSAQLGEPERDLALGAVGRVGGVHQVLPVGQREVAPDGAGGGLAAVGGADQRRAPPRSPGRRRAPGRPAGRRS